MLFSLKISRASSTTSTTFKVSFCWAGMDAKLENADATAPHSINLLN
jgi:hypothetical protein